MWCVCVSYVRVCGTYLCVCVRVLPFEKEGQKKLTSVYVCVRVLPFEEEGRKKLMTNDRP